MTRERPKYNGKQVVNRLVAEHPEIADRLRQGLSLAELKGQYPGVSQSSIRHALKRLILPNELKAINIAHKSSSQEKKEKQQPRRIQSREPVAIKSRKFSGEETIYFQGHFWDSELRQRNSDPLPGEPDLNRMAIRMSEVFHKSFSVKQATKLKNLVRTTRGL